MKCLFVLIVSYLLLSPVALAQTAGQFEIRYDVSALTATEQTQLQPSLDAAANVWESLIIGYQPGVTLDGIDLDVSTFAGDGPGGALAQAGPGPTGFLTNFMTNQGDFSFATDTPVNFFTPVASSVGAVQIDEDDFSTLLIVDVLVHEIGHALGFGTLFSQNNLTSAAGEYSGPEGLAAFQAEYDPTAAFIPLESDNGHYLEATSLTDASGRLLSREILTPIVTNTQNANDPTSNYVSETTLGVFRDLGYRTATVATVPEPSALVLLSLGLLGVSSQRRRAIS